MIMICKFPPDCDYMPDAGIRRHFWWLSSVVVFIPSELVMSAPYPGKCIRHSPFFPAL